MRVLGRIATPAMAISMCLWPHASRAQTMSGEVPPPPRHQVTAGDVSAMRDLLRALGLAEEQYWADHGTYTTDLGALKLLVRGEGNPRVVVVYAGGRSWFAEAGYSPEFARTCVMYVGELTDIPGNARTQADSIAPAEATVPVCDAPDAPEE